MTERHQINVGLPEIVIDSLDHFIQYGDKWDIEPSPDLKKYHPNVPTLDISRTTLIRYLLTAYGHKTTEIGDLINAEIVSNHEPLRFITVRTEHPELVENRGTRQYRLISAMVYMGIPILHYFDGRNITF